MKRTGLPYLLTLKKLNPVLMEIIDDERQTHKGQKNNVEAEWEDSMQG